MGMLLSNLDVLATAPGGVARLRELILTLAVQGKLVPQDPGDEPASELLKKIRAEKDRLIAEGKIKRDKPLAGITNNEKPFGLPVGWTFCQLGDLLLSIRSGGTPSKQNPDFWNGSIPWASVKDLHFGDPISDTQDRITQAGLDAGSELAPAGSILICTRMGLGKIGEALIDVAINQDLKAVLLGAGVNKQYFINYFKTLALVGSGMTVAGIKQDELLGLTVPLPPLAEQLRIVTRVEELMRLCDALEVKGQLEAAQHAQLVATLLGTLTHSDTPAQLAENWQRVASHFDLLLDRPQAVDALEQTILQLAVRGLLVPQDPQDEPASALLKKIRAEKDQLIAQGKIKRDKTLLPIAEDDQPFALPQGWEWVPVGDVVEMLNGYAFKSEWFKKAGTRLLRNVNVAHGHVDWSTPAFIDNALASEFDQFALNEGDVVLTLDRPIISTGLKLAVLQKHDLPCLLLQRVARLSPVPQLLSQEYLVLWMQSDAFVGTLDPGRSNGVPHISTKQVASMAFPLPPLAEQSRIVTRVTHLRQLCAELRTHLSASQSTQAHLAEALIADLPA